MPGYRSAILVTASLLTACAGVSGSRRQAAEPPPARGSAIAVIERAEIEASSARGTHLVEFLRARVPSLEIVEAGGTGCPRMRLRGSSSMHFPSEPDIYIDGVRTDDTCVLLTLSMHLVTGIQVYGGGQSPPGASYGSSPGGLILVFTSR